VIRSTTILGVRRDGRVALGGDGQVSVGNMVVKQGARKVRRLHRDAILVGFAGSAADALTLFEKLEGKLDEYRGNLPRAAVELAKEWRMDRALRRLEALLAAMDREHAFIISGTGDVIEPDDGIVSLGSGGGFALAAARALIASTDLPARGIVERSLQIAADICVFTNRNLQIEEL
jgi:ATP-dependent HslUV protease subunit HslV